LFYQGEIGNKPGETAGRTGRTGNFALDKAKQEQERDGRYITGGSD